jgi:hypothetical protein
LLTTVLLMRPEVAEQVESMGAYRKFPFDTSEKMVLNRRIRCREPDSAAAMAKFLEIAPDMAAQRRQHRSPSNRAAIRSLTEDMAAP